MYRTVFILALSCVMLSGCSTSKEEMLPAGDNTMLELWNGADGGGSTSRQSAAVRVLRKAKSPSSFPGCPTPTW